MNGRDVALYALLVGIWGSTWLVIKEGYGGLGPFTVAAWRFGIAGLALAALSPLMKWRSPSGRTEWSLAAFVGLVLFAMDYGLIYWAETRLDSGLTAVVFAVMPLLTALAAHVYVPSERLTARTLGGTSLAFVGVAALFADNLRLDVTLAFPILAILGSASCAAIASVATKRHGGRMHPATLNAPAMLVGAAALLVAALISGERVAMPADVRTWSAVGYLAVAGSIVTFLIYFRLLKTHSTTTMSFIAVLTPLVALTLGFVVRGERPAAFTAVGAALVLAGVAFAVTGQRRSKVDASALSDPDVA